MVSMALSIGVIRHRIFADEMSYPLAYRIEPFVYRVLTKCKMAIVADDEPLPSEYPLLKDYRAGSVISPRLRQVCGYATHVLMRGIPVEEVEAILPLCINIRNLALWKIQGDHVPLREIISSLPIQRLSIDTTLLFVRHPRCETTFNHITHLDAVCFGGSLWGRGRTRMHLLPCLTHLAIRGTLNELLVEPILRTTPSLKLLIYCSKDDMIDDGDAYHDDLRLVHVHPPDTPIAQWCHGAVTGIDLWTTGEGLQLKKARYILPR